MSEYTRSQPKVDSAECNLLIDLVKKATKMFVEGKVKRRIDAARIAIDLADYGTGFTNDGIVDGYVKRLVDIHKNGGKAEFSSKYTCVNKVIESVYEDVFGSPLITDGEQKVKQIDGQMNIDDINVPNQCDMERMAMEMGEEEPLPFTDIAYPEEFDTLQSDVYMFLTGLCKSFSWNDGVYTLEIDQKSLESIFKRRT